TSCPPIPARLASRVRRDARAPWPVNNPGWRTMPLSTRAWMYARSGARRAGAPVHRAEGEQRLSLRGRDAGEPGDLHALVEAIRAQRVQPRTTLGVPQAHRAIQRTTGHQAPV